MLPLKAEYINPLISSFINVYKSITNFDIKIGELFIRNNSLSANDIVVIIGITGDLNGQLILSFSKETALNIVSKMMMDTPILELDDMSISAIGELGNIIIGNYITSLSNNNLKIDITTPTVLSGDKMKINLFNKKQISVPFNSDLGKMVVDISISEK